MAFSATGPGFTVDRNALATITFNNNPGGIDLVFITITMGGLPYSAWLLNDPTTLFYLGGSSQSYVGTTLTLKLRPQGGWVGPSVQLSYAVFNLAGALVETGGLSWSTIDSTSTPGPLPIGVGAGGLGFGLD